MLRLLLGAFAGFAVARLIPPKPDDEPGPELLLPESTALTPPEMSTQAILYVHYMNRFGKPYWSGGWAGVPEGQPSALRITLDKTPQLVVWMQLCGLRDLKPTRGMRPYGFEPGADYEAIVEPPHEGGQGGLIGAPDGIPEQYAGGIAGCRIWLVGEWAPLFKLRYKVHSHDGITRDWIDGGQWWGTHAPGAWPKNQTPVQLKQILLEIAYAG